MPSSIAEWLFHIVLTVSWENMTFYICTCCIFREHEKQVCRLQTRKQIIINVSRLHHSSWETSTSKFTWSRYTEWNIKVILLKLFSFQ